MTEKPDLFPSSEQERKRLTREHKRKLLIFVLTLLALTLISSLIFLYKTP